jgi:peptidoglycan/LPS O-acetylase OafA/YrhL
VSATPESRIPCLDGLRAVSISFVILWHLVGHRTTPVRFDTIGDMGNLGVRTFFVISGFLITTLLVNELSRTGRISLGQFYLRRTFRIFPAFYVYIGAISIAAAAGWVALKRHDLLAAVTYTMNYHDNRAWELGHLWSLAVEEQFYLIWPATMVLLGARRGLWVTLAVMAGAPIVRVATHEFVPSMRPLISETFQTVSDSLATGCALALLQPRMSATPWFLRVQRHPATPLVLLAIAVGTNAFHARISFGYPIGQTLTNVSLALLVDACVRNPETPVGRFLEKRPLVFIGTLSYSIYLWQQPFLNTHRHAWATSFPVNLAIVAVLATLSHYVVEKPMLEVRKRFSRARRAVPAG